MRTHFDPKGGSMPWDYTAPETWAWLEEHHDPKFKEKKYRPRKTSFRALSPKRRKEIEYEWESEIRYQVSKHGPHNFLPLNLRNDPKTRAVMDRLEKNGLK